MPHADLMIADGDEFVSECGRVRVAYDKDGWTVWREAELVDTHATRAAALVDANELARELEVADAG